MASNTVIASHVLIVTQELNFNCSDAGTHESDRNFAQDISTSAEKIVGLKGKKIL